MKKFIAFTAIMVLCLAFAGCGNSGFSEGEKFELAENTYALEKIVKAADKDTDSTECYGVSVLQVGNTAPVIMSGFGSGTTQTKSAIEMILNDGDKKYVTTSISFAATDEVEGYGSRVIFYFDLPKGTDIPESATLKVTDGEEAVELDLSGLKTEEEKTADTSSDKTEKPDVPVAEDAGNENYEGVGNTDAYDGIGDTKIFNADDTIQDDIVKPGL